MSSSNNNSYADDRKPAAKPAPSEPTFRSVDIARPPSLAGIGLRGSADVIDKSSYFGAYLKTTTEDSKKSASAPTARRASWSPTELRQVPAFYPLERSSRFVEADLSTVVVRVSEANRLLSIHAVYCDETATATLLTGENVEMHLSLWKPSGSQGGIVIEIQRRKGDSITFHRYSRCILDAVAGDLDISDHVEKNGDDIDAVFSRKVQRLLTLEAPQDSRTETENAIIAIEIAHGLMMKDRIDANQLGLESLCLLTDAKKTGLTTALIASRVVLLGSVRDVNTNNSAPEEALLCDETPFQEIRQALLSLIQFRRIGDGDDFGHAEASSQESEQITILHNLALAVLANALDVIENEDLDSAITSTPEEVPSGRSRIDTSESISERFLVDSMERSENREIIKTLITELGKADLKPHNACLSAKCIGSLCRASDKARKKAEELGAKNVVQTALEVGTRTHLKLQRECTKVLSSLTRTLNDE
mmetsp:Transcript_14408/g.33514  ORF Transcript_14408/g.33514 Transcript_14408/m.33514 type:complete len:478 (+) Transcript_14408:138-1571(+)|eukprot:CAMPEP_0197181926 /NCGR_PEP_ID=MMETSP1423-20130617/6058_1 /TAXON_ID=476441 /ORGANISM="Pseudo-nitzschia heimii, Strain UNC1101" /LENGTH=477 /DNA_ID=CAMNT_0042632271 /DNA_START=103 /DNA_END=1536 /DNA_ORIENTATION=+